jgi:hypothetical protein
MTAPQVKVACHGEVKIPFPILQQDRLYLLSKWLATMRPRAAQKPTDLLPALNTAGSELNTLAATNIPLANAKFAVVFHGPAVDGIFG